MPLPFGCRYPQFAIGVSLVFFVDCLNYLFYIRYNSLLTSPAAISTTSKEPPGSGGVRCYILPHGSMSFGNFENSSNSWFCDVPCMISLIPNSIYMCIYMANVTLNSVSSISDSGVIEFDIS
jgi:hypothetical protein